MATIAKTQGTSVLSLQSVALGSIAISSAFDVSTKFAATVFIHFGRRSATNAGAPVNVRVEASAKSANDGQWYPLAIFPSDFGAVTSQALTGTVNAGQAVLTMANTTGFSTGNIIYIDNGTIANSEWGRVKAINTNVSVTIEDNLLNAQTGSTVYTGAQMFVAQLDLTAVGRIRIVDEATNFSQAHAVEAFMVTGDSIA